MRSEVIKRSIVVDKRKTSVSLEDAFWEGLKEIAKTDRSTLSALVALIDARGPHCNRSSAIRLFVLDRLRARRPKSRVAELDAKVGNGEAADERNYHMESPPPSAAGA